MRGSRKHTIIDVAQRAGVSKSTAARALSGGGEISGETRDRVLEAARALGYERNHLAVGMRSGRSGMLGLVIFLICDAREDQAGRVALRVVADRAVPLAVVPGDANGEVMDGKAACAWCERVHPEWPNGPVIKHLGRLCPTLH